MTSPAPQQGKIVSLHYGIEIERLSELDAALVEIANVAARHGLALTELKASNWPARDTLTGRRPKCVALSATARAEATAGKAASFTAQVKRASALAIAFRDMGQALGAIDKITASTPGDGLVHIRAEGRAKVDTQSVAAAE